MNAKLDASEVTAAYTAAFRRLRALTGFDTKAVLRAEAGSILKAWAATVKVKTEEMVERSTRASIGKRLGTLSGGGSNPYGITVNTGTRKLETRGDVWFRTRKGEFQRAGYITPDGVYLPENMHFRAEDWARIKQGAQQYAAQLKRRLPMVKRSAGLGRQSVIQIADSLGIDLLQVEGGRLSAAAIAKARAAIASTGNNYQNGKGTQGGDDNSAYVELLNTLPYNTKAHTTEGKGMDNALLWVLSGRANFIKKSYEKGAFDSMAKTMKAFPNVFKEAAPT